MRSEPHAAAQRADGLRWPAFRRFRFARGSWRAPSITVPDDLMRRLKSAGQEHVLARWDRLSDAERGGLSTQLQGSTWTQLTRLYAERDHAYHAAGSWDAIKPVPVVPADSPDNPRHTGGSARNRCGAARSRRWSWPADRAAASASIIPRACSRRPGDDKSLFQIHAEKVLATRRRYGAAVPFLRHDQPGHRRARRGSSSPKTGISDCRRRKCISSARARCRRWTWRRAGC